MFIVGLDDAIEAGALVLAHHMNLNAHEIFTEFSGDLFLDKVCELLADPRWIPRAGPTTYHIAS